VLHHLKYGDTSLILHVFTQKYGRSSFIVKGIRQKRSRFAPGIMQPLSSVNIDFYYKENKDLHLVKDISTHLNFYHFPYDMKKSSQAMFLAEVLYKCLQTQDRDEDLYSFLLHSLEYFDSNTGAQPNFHLHFLIKLTRYLGISPFAASNTDNHIFDIQEGAFSNRMPGHSNFFDRNNTILLQNFLEGNYENSTKILLKKDERNAFLNEVLKFYSYHHSNMENIKSLEVLKQIF